MHHAMRSLLPLLIWLMFAVLAGNGAAHASEAMCCPGDDQSSAVMVCGDPGADAPADRGADRDPSQAHAHGICHGHHAVAAVDMLALPGRVVSNDVVGLRRATGLRGYAADPALRPPQA
jgi:hypothetical protein